MLELLFNPVGIIVVPLAAAVPWLVAMKGGRRGAWLSAGYVIVLLLLLPFALLLLCLATSCGQGAILVLPVGLGCAVAAVATLISAAVAAYVCRDKSAGDGARPEP